MPTKRGQCRCGAVLQFTKGPTGYKTRCGSCGSVVRLQVPRVRRRANEAARPRPLAQTSIPVLETNPLALIEQTGSPTDTEEADEEEPVASFDDPLEMIEMEAIDGEPDWVPPPSGVSGLVVRVAVGSILVMGLIAGAVWYFLR